MLQALIQSAALVFVAELGDKTQIVALSLAARWGFKRALAGIAIGVVAVQLLAVLAGGILGNFVPLSWMRIGAGVAFLGFGLWALWTSRKVAEEQEEVEEAERAAEGRASRFGPVLGIAAVFFALEFGDKTQLAALTIAARQVAEGDLAPAVATLSVWAGACTGMIVADGMAVALGAVLGTRVPERAITIASGVVFVLFGVYTLATAL